MRFRTFICAALFTAAFSMTSLAADHSVQVVSFGTESGGDTAIELNSSKVITEDFSFKVPDGWKGTCVLVPDGDSYGIYDKTAYELDGSGLLFTISCYEDVNYSELEGCSILGFCDSRTYILEAAYEDFLEDPDTAEYKACEEASKLLKKSFVSFVKEPAE